MLAARAKIAGNGMLPRMEDRTHPVRLSAWPNSSRFTSEALIPAGLGVQLESLQVARFLPRKTPRRRCIGTRKADPSRQPPGACTQASATAGSAPARHDSGPRGVADGAESAPEARPAAGWSPRALSGCRHGHLRSSCARCASRWPGAAARALCRCLLSLDGRRAPCSRPILSLPPASGPERPPPHTDY